MLKIGDFARFARVTVKTLRFYDRVGLFTPAYVEPRSGYRFYRANQIPTLQRIRLLRDLGCSIAEVRNLVSMAPDSADYAYRLRALRKRLMVRVAADEQRLIQLDTLLGAHEGQAPDRSLCPVAERRIAPVPALTVRDRVRSLGTDVEHIFEATERQVALKGLRAPASPFLLLHDMEYRDTHIDIEVCVPIAPESLTACGGRVVDGADQAACLSFAGSYEQAPLLYDQMLEWMDNAGTRIAGTVRETYIRFGADQCGYALPPQVLAGSAAEYQTELQIPIASV